jgi:hypothetical protein
MSDIQHLYEQVPGVGKVAISRTAQGRVTEHAITRKQFEDALYTPVRKVPDGSNIELWEHGDVRLVVNLRPEPYRNAALVTTAYRVKPIARTVTPSRDRRRG